MWASSCAWRKHKVFNEGPIALGRAVDDRLPRSARENVGHALTRVSGCKTEPYFAHIVRGEIIRDPLLIMGDFWQGFLRAWLRRILITILCIELRHAGNKARGHRHMSWQQLCAKYTNAETKLCSQLHAAHAARVRESHDNCGPPTHPVTTPSPTNEALQAPTERQYDFVRAQTPEQLHRLDVIAREKQSGPVHVCSKAFWGKVTREYAALGRDQLEHYKHLAEPANEQAAARRRMCKSADSSIVDQDRHHRDCVPTAASSALAPLGTAKSPNAAALPFSRRWSNYACQR